MRTFIASLLLTNLLACVGGKEAEDSGDTADSGDVGTGVYSIHNGCDRFVNMPEYIGHVPTDAVFFAVFVDSEDGATSVGTAYLTVVEAVGEDEHPVFFTGDCESDESVVAYYYRAS